MKNIIFAICLFQTLIASASEGLPKPLWLTTQNAGVSTFCVVYGSPGQSYPANCPVAVAISTTEMGLTTLLFKEAQEVKSDAINYLAGEEVTPALDSVVEKIQAAALEQGKEVSFDEVIDALIQM